MGRLDGKVAIITGAARGQGEAEARRFVAEGAKVVLVDILDDLGEKVAADLGAAAAVFVHLDVGDEAGWPRALEAADALGPLTVLVNNAGILKPYAIEDTTLESYLEVIRTNQVGCFLGMRAAIAPMRRAGGGSIVNVSSTDGLRSMNGLISYSASKFAIRGMTKTAAIELGQYGIRVLTLQTGGIPETIPEGLSWRQAITEQTVRRTMLGRAATLADVGNAAVIAASDYARTMTGTALNITCGAVPD